MRPCGQAFVASNGVKFVRWLVVRVDENEFEATNAEYDIVLSAPPHRRGAIGLHPGQSIWVFYNEDEDLTFTEVDPEAAVC